MTDTDDDFSDEFFDSETISDTETDTDAVTENANTLVKANNTETDASDSGDEYEGDDMSNYDHYFRRESVDEEDSENQEKGRKKCRLFVKISGMSPFVLQLNSGLEIVHYRQIVDEYYSKLYNGNPPAPLFIYKIVNFANGDILYEYKRRTTASAAFSIVAQQNTDINMEPPPCEESITFIKNPYPDLCPLAEIPRFVALNRLLLILTDPNGTDFIEKVFMYTHRKLAKPSLILSKLLERFDIPDIPLDSPDFSAIEKQYYMIQLKPSVQRKVVSVICNWIDTSFFDFDDKMILSLQEFCNKRLVPAGYNLDAEDILEKTKTSSRAEVWKNARSTERLFGIFPNKIAKMLGDMVQPTSINVLAMTFQEIAEQLTYIDSRLYNEIHFTEMLNQSWNKEDRRHMAPNIIANINFFNVVSNWVVYTILKQENLRERKSVIKKFIEVANHLVELNSFSMMMAINGAMNSIAVYRLSQTWEQITEKWTQKKEKMQDLASGSQNSKALRSKMKEVYDAGQACCPFAAVYLKDLVFVDDGNPTFIDGKINFHKCAQQYVMMHQVLRFQGRPYHITPNREFIQELVTYKLHDENSLYNMSLAIQPKKN